MTDNQWIALTDWNDEHHMWNFFMRNSIHPTDQNTKQPIDIMNKAKLKYKSTRFLHTNIFILLKYVSIEQRTQHTKQG